MLSTKRGRGAEFNRIAGENCLYFETGQGSALSAGANLVPTSDDGSAYPAGWRYQYPFSVNTVVALSGRSILTPGADYPRRSRRSLYGQAERHLDGLRLLL